MTSRDDGSEFDAVFAAVHGRPPKPEDLTDVCPVCGKTLDFSQTTMEPLPGFSLACSVFCAIKQESDAKKSGAARSVPDEQ